MFNVMLLILCIINKFSTEINCDNSIAHHCRIVNSLSMILISSSYVTTPQQREKLFVKVIKEIVNTCRKLSCLKLVGLLKLQGSWLKQLEVHLPRLKLLDLSQCDAIDDVELFSLIKRFVVEESVFSLRSVVNNVINYLSFSDKAIVS